MTFSYTVPCHKRQEDLAKALPFVVEAANVHAQETGTARGVEIVIVDYANPSELSGFPYLDYPNRYRLVTYRGRNHYHMSHARNLSIKASTGDFVIISASDICPKPEYFSVVQKRLEETGVPWLQPDVQFVGVIVCRRKELIAAGGYDERIAYYGSEDRDLSARLRRRGLASAPYQASELLTMFRTTNAEKIRNYGIKMSKMEMMRHGSAIFKENIRKNVLVANEGQPWGQS